MAAYGIWEAALAALSLAALARVHPLSNRLALALALHLMLAGLSATALSFLRANSVEAYLALAVIFTAAALWMRPRVPVWRGAVTAFGPALPAVFALGLALVLSLTPIEEVDSLYNLHYVMRWVDNRATPYEFAYHYVPFWELTTVPLLTLAHRDTLLWTHSLKPVVLLGLALWRIAAEMGTPRRWAPWLIGILMLLPHLWTGPSGVVTIKNDMMHAAGYAMAAVCVVRAAHGRFQRTDWLWVAFAAVFVSVKSSGPAAIVLGLGVAAIAARHWVARNVRQTAFAAAASFALWMVCAGQYFVHNYVAFDNPVYPYRIAIGPMEFAGLADQSGTSLLANITNPGMWKLLLLPREGVFPAGGLFSLSMLLILGGGGVALAHAVWRRRLTALAALGLFEWIAWLIFAGSYFSAGPAAGDLLYLRSSLNTVRYIEGPLLVGQLVLASLLLRWRAGSVAMGLLLALHAATSLQALTRYAPDRSWVAALLCAAGLTVIARSRIPLAQVAALIGVAFAGEKLVEQRRVDWLPGVRPLYEPLRQLASRDVYYVIDDPYSQQACWHFPMLGSRLQHTTSSGSPRKLIEQSQPPDYVVWVRANSGAEPPDPPGFVVAVEDEAGRLYRRQGTTSSPPTP